MRHIFIQLCLWTIKIIANGLNRSLVLEQKRLYDQKSLVWCAISANRVFGPYYFEDTVNRYNYLEMLKKNGLKTADYEKHYFQQDGAGSHTARTEQTCLKHNLTINSYIMFYGLHVLQIWIWFSSMVSSKVVGLQP